MSPGTLRRHIMTVIAAAVALILAALMVPASAPAATVHAAGQQHPQLGQPFRVSTKPIKGGGPDVVVGNALCLANKNTYCAAMSPVNWANIVIGGTSDLLSWIAIWLTIKSGNSEEQKKDGTADGGNQEGNNLCLGATGYNGNVKLESCSTPHGVWWQDQSVSGGYRIWNTGYSGFLESSGNSGTRLFINNTAGNWVKWAFEYCNGC